MTPPQICLQIYHLHLSDQIPYMAYQENSVTKCQRWLKRKNNMYFLFSCVAQKSYLYLQGICREVLIHRDLRAILSYHTTNIMFFLKRTIQLFKQSNARTQNPSSCKWSLEALGISVLGLGIEPGPLAVRVPSHNHWPTKEFPISAYFNVHLVPHETSF